MARKSIVELQNELFQSFPDNIVGAITPAILRDYLNDFLEAIRPAYGAISRTTAAVQSIGTTDTPVTFDTAFVSDVPDYTANAATGTITRLSQGTTRFTINMDVEAANGRVITATLYLNGAPTPWRGAVTGLGAGKPAVLSINGLNYVGGQAIYQLQMRADVAATSVTVSHADMVMETVPANAY